VCTTRARERRRGSHDLRTGRGSVFVGQYSRALGDVLDDLSLKRLGLSVRDMNGPKLAIALDNTEHNGLVRAALRARRPQNP